MMPEQQRLESREDTHLLHYRVQGSGPRVAMLHPVGLDLTCFDEVAAALSERFTVLSVDLRGHGCSPALRPAQSLEDYSEDVHALLQYLDFAPAGIVGFSFGGMVAQVLAITYPEDVSALVIATCASTLSDDVRRTLADRGAQAQRDGMEAVIEATLVRWFSDAFRERGGDGQVRRRLLATGVDAWAQAWSAMSAVHTAPKLQAIRVPTLCLAGAADVSAPPHVLQEIVDSITGARLEVVPGAPHMLFIEYPSIVTQILKDFLCSVLGAKAGGS